MGIWYPERRIAMIDPTGDAPPLRSAYQRTGVQYQGSITDFTHKSKLES